MNLSSVPSFSKITSHIFEKKPFSRLTMSLGARPSHSVVKETMSQKRIETSRSCARNCVSASSPAVRIRSMTLCEWYRCSRSRRRASRSNCSDSRACSIPIDA